MAKTVLKICGLEWKNASRDKRELSVCKELGMNAIVMAKGVPRDRFRKDEVDGFTVYRFSSRPVKWLPVCVNRILSLFLWAYDARRLKPDIISGHNLIGVGIGWISTWFMTNGKKPTLVYDSHEFEIGRNDSRSRLMVWWITHLERFLIKRCAFSIMVNDSIADEVQRVHHLKKRPIVVRSTPDKWELDEVKVRETRREICTALGVSDDAFIIMYHGMLMPSRNIEALLEAVYRNDSIYGLILGDASPASFVDTLKAYSKKLGIENRILFHSAVSACELPYYVSNASVGMILHRKYAKNADYSLPNKFFENVQGMTPLISTNTAVLDSYISKLGIGIAVDIENNESIDAAIQKIKTNSSFYANCKSNLSKARSELCWEKEKKTLVSAYKTLMEQQLNER